MAALASLSDLLDSLSRSLNSALEAVPNEAALESLPSGISLLDVKNDLLLSYLQNLIFLILLKIRNAKYAPSRDSRGGQKLDDLVVRKLVELRVYLEKGVRPLEEKLGYQIEKALRAADDSERKSQAADAVRGANGRKVGDESASGTGSESEQRGSGGDDDVEEEESDLDDSETERALPNRNAFVRPSTGTAAAAKHPATKASAATDVYRPPKIAPTVMPTTERREKSERKPIKSATMDEFIADELSTAPMVEPSIGTNIHKSGRQVKTALQRKEEDERREYEEKNFIRLPKESKKERAKRAKVEGHGGRMNFGGEEWRELGEGVDRIHRLTKGKSSGGGTRALLDKSRKRGLDTVDGPRGSGAEMGERYQKRLKLLEVGRRDRGKDRRK